MDMPLFRHATVDGLLDNLHRVNCAIAKVAVIVGGDLVPTCSPGPFAGDLQVHYHFDDHDGAVAHLDTLTETFAIDWDPSGDLDDDDVSVLGLAHIGGIKVFFHLPAPRRVAA
jgi:hypothetical protein